MSENGEIYTAGKNFTLPPALTALTNSTSGFLFNARAKPQEFFISMAQNEICRKLLPHAWSHPMNKADNLVC